MDSDNPIRLSDPESSEPSVQTSGNHKNGLLVDVASELLWQLRRWVWCSWFTHGKFYYNVQIYFLITDAFEEQYKLNNKSFLFLLTSLVQKGKIQ
jgi:hypothetical protein